MGFTQHITNSARTSEWASHSTSPIRLVRPNGLHTACLNPYSHFRILDANNSGDVHVNPLESSLPPPIGGEGLPCKCKNKGFTCPRRNFVTLDACLVAVLVAAAVADLHSRLSPCSRWR
ncbi:hypothetical protein KSP39_PZI010320 [Platanthera zijinensis]|uniref:Uncharacterized protein n=1 Tax=Platanthera zijinensis TaxID=2320716 RepID=A0AAP0G740_9ASPA